MLQARVLTALILLVVLAAALFGLPPSWWALALLLAALGAAYEWGKLAGMDATPLWLFVGGTLLIAALLLTLTGFFLAQRWPSRLIFAVTGASLAFWVLLAPAWLAFQWRVRSQAGLAVVGWLLIISAWMSIVQLQSRSPWLCLAFMALVWIADIAAYFAGRRFGKHKLAPSISPGKTWEGVYGGLVGVTLYSALLWGLAGSFGYSAERTLPRAAAAVAVGLALACLSVLGDLFESWMKRVRGVKDSGTLLPGHGGVLDRVDALISAMPAAALCAEYYLR